MKLKLRPSRKQLTVVAVVALLVGGVLVARSAARTARAGGLDAPADRACTDFAAGYSQARTKAARLSLADQVTRSSSQSRNATIAERAAEVGRRAGDTDARWKASANGLTGACRAAGWHS